MLEVQGCNTMLGCYVHAAVNLITNKVDSGGKTLLLCLLQGRHCPVPPLPDKTGDLGYRQQAPQSLTAKSPLHRLFPQSGTLCLPCSFRFQKCCFLQEASADLPDQAGEALPPGLPCSQAHWPPEICICLLPSWGEE